MTLIKYTLAASTLWVGLGLGAATPAAHAQARFFQFGSSGAFLGVRMEDVTAANMAKYKLSSERGVIVTDVVKDSPAEKANIREGDVIVEFGGFQVWSAVQLTRLVEETPPGRKVDLVVSRDGKRINLTAQIGSNGDRRSGSRNGLITPTPPDLREFDFQAPFGPDNRRRGVDSTKKPRLGITLQPLTEQLAEYFGVPGRKGALVSGVSSGSASEGKLRVGDVIIGADDKAIGSPEDLIGFVEDKAEGPITLKVIRDKKEVRVVVNLPSSGNEGSYKL